MSLVFKAGIVGFATFLWAAGAVAQCVVGATDVAFGTYSYRNGSSSQGQITVQCSVGDPFSIRLSSGTGPYFERRLVGPDGRTLSYNLYTTASLIEVWGDGVASGTGAVAGSGNGATQSFPVFGRMPARQAANPGTYADNIVVTVWF